MTQNRLRDYEGDNLLRAFPLQFPYGLGRLLANEASSNNKCAMNVQLNYISHLQRMSIRHMHQGDFTLILHNMFERHKAISLAYLQCMHNVGNDTVGKHFGNMTLTELERAIHQAQSNLSIQDQTAKQFLKSFDAICKSMAHTNDAAKGARLKLFANMVRFGRPSIFSRLHQMTVTLFGFRFMLVHSAKIFPHVMMTVPTSMLIMNPVIKSIRNNLTYMCIRFLPDYGIARLPHSWRE